MPPPPRQPVSSRDALVDLAERQTPRAIYVVSLLTAVAAFTLAIMRVPDTRRTRVAPAPALHAVSRAVSLFAADTGALPADLDELLGGWLDGAARLEDDWGRPILYARTADGDALLISLGADAGEGGDGHDQDVVVRVPRPAQRLGGVRPLDSLASLPRCQYPSWIPDYSSPRGVRSPLRARFVPGPRR